jgi:hypothetical protein
LLFTAEKTRGGKLSITITIDSIELGRVVAALPVFLEINLYR